MQDFSNVKVVLVNPSHPGNIGASARAMKNMGLENMTLVQPEQFPSGVAVGRAASAVDVLESAIVVNSLRSAVAECGLVIGASARSRRIPWPMLSPRECAEKISEGSYSSVAIVFGKESSGLSNEEFDDPL
jgi:tRNA (cytidine32/uridine32-2'-O)-methyltransferase